MEYFNLILLEQHYDWLFWFLLANITIRELVSASYAYRIAMVDIAIVIEVYPDDVVDVGCVEQEMKYFHQLIYHENAFSEMIKLFQFPK